ncbi:MAG: 3-dehydroquinate synthase [Bauldia sp.]|nr:3-dehydroquinate synthase [Bauldia sp.]
MTEAAASSAPRSPTTVVVDLGDRSYDILIGRDIIDRAGGEIAERLPGARMAIVTDANVADTHLRTLTRSLEAADVEYVSIVVPPGEGTKSFAAFETVIEALLEARIERSDAVLALGGGVVGDLAGFAAGTVLRGIRFVQMPTSLLAQVDSSVGGKTGINSTLGKNLVGAFHQPKLVLADIDLLDTLAERDFRAGYAEVVKYGLLGDAGFFDWLEAEGGRLAAGDSAARTRAVRRSCEMKVDLVVRDETEQGDRALLNLGHTFGHALEAAAGYSGRLLHGEGVSIGMVLAFGLSEKLGHCTRADVERVIAHLSDVGLPTRISQIPGKRFTADELMALMAQDKKVKRGRLTFILVKGIGRAFIASDVPIETVQSFLEESLRQ